MKTTSPTTQRHIQVGLNFPQNGCGILKVTTSLFPWKLIHVILEKFISLSPEYTSQTFAFIIIKYRLFCQQGHRLS